MQSCPTQMTYVWSWNWNTTSLFSSIVFFKGWKAIKISFTQLHASSCLTDSLVGTVHSCGVSAKLGFKVRGLRSVRFNTLYLWNCPVTSFYAHTVIPETTLGTTQSCWSEPQNLSEPCFDILLNFVFRLSAVPENFWLLPSFPCR